MRGIMKSKGMLAVCAFAAAITLGGCSGSKLPDTVDTPTVSIREDGQITYWLVGEFDKDYYEITELTEMAAEEAAAFNEERAGESGQAAVSVEKVEALQDESQTVVITYLFDVWESFRDFTKGELFYGTVADAAKTGFEAHTALKTVKGDAVLSGEEMLKDSEKQLIVTDVKANIYCPGKVTHLSEGAVLNKDGSVDTSGVEGLVYILMK